MVEVIVPSRFDLLVNGDGTPTTLFSAYLESLTDNSNNNIDIVEPYYRSLAALAALRAEVEDLKIIHSVSLIPVDDVLQKRIDDLQEELIGFVMGLVNQKDLTGFLRNMVGDATPQLGGNLDTQSFTVDGRDVGTDGTKLDGIESGATQDQTDPEIKTAYENNADTNAFTDNEQTKLDGIETGATTDQTAGDIRTLGFFDTTNDGTGSGFDADLLDGNHATAFATSAQGTLADSALQNIVEDVSPQLGAILDTNNFNIDASSSGILLGGTDATNNLTFYKTGVFTPVIADAATGGNIASTTTSAGSFTRVGNIVRAVMRIDNIDTTGMTGTNLIFIRGLPFPTKTGTTRHYGTVTVANFVTFSGYITVRAGSGASELLIFDNTSGAAAGLLTVNTLASGTADLEIEITYLA